MRPAAILTLLALLAACVPPEGAPTTATVTTAATTTTTSTTLLPTTGEEQPPPCLAGDQPFQADGAAGSYLAPDTDAAVVTALDWEVHDDCEQLFVSFSTPEGAPAVAPPSVQSFLIRPAGVLRLDLGEEIVGTAIADQLVETELVGRVYVVTALDGTSFIDLHLRAPAFARVDVDRAPARVVVDLQPGGEELGAPTERPGEIVVVQPASAMASYPLTVSGYLRTGETDVEGVLRSLEDGSQEVATATAGDQTDAWGSFSLVFPDGPTGAVTVTVAGLVTLELRIP